MCENASSCPCCLFPPAVSLRSGAGDGCDVLHVGVSQQALHGDAHSPGKTFWLGLGVIVVLWLACQCVLHTVFFYKAVCICNYIFHQASELSNYYFMAHP